MEVGPNSPQSGPQKIGNTMEDHTKAKIIFYYTLLTIASLTISFTAQWTTLRDLLLVFAATVYSLVIEYIQ